MQDIIILCVNENRTLMEHLVIPHHIMVIKGDGIMFHIAQHENYILDFAEH